MEIEVEAESLSQAKDKVRAQIPPRHYLESEKVVSNGSSRTAVGQAETESEAFAQAQAQVPSNATILTKRLLSTTGTHVETADAVDAESAKAKVRNEASVERSIKDVRLVAPGSKGFLGIGRRPNKYEVTFTTQTVAEIAYRVPAKVIATVTSLTGILFRPLQTVPESGRWRCFSCREGFGAMMAMAMGGRTAPSAPVNLRKGDSFPECPQCGKESAWELAE